MKDRLRKAARSVPAPPGLEIRIREQLRARPRSHWWTPWLIPAAAIAAAAVLFLVPYQSGHFRLTKSSRASYIAAVSYRVGAMMRLALGDHIECAVFRKYPDHAPTPAKLEADLGPEFQGLVPIVESHVPEQYTLMMAHKCGFDGRKFVHLTWKNDAHLLSLLIARREPGETFDSMPALPSLETSGIPIYRSGVQRFQIAAFESGDFLVYFISDLPAPENTKMMVALAPGIRDFLEHPRS